MGDRGREAYEAFKEKQAGISRERSRKGRDIGPLPAVVNPKRRAAAAKSLRKYCETYYAAMFYLEWSAAHLQAIEKIERAIRKGGLFAMALPRGSGKTTLLMIAAEWALLNGYRVYVVVIAANQPKAEKLIKDLKTNLEANDLLAEDYPEVCYPIRCLERNASRATGQLLDGESTRIEWTANEIALPTVPGSKSSGARITAVGITGSVRGLKATRLVEKKRLKDGKVKWELGTIRPDVALLDDPQDKESAESPKQVQDRMTIIKGDVLGLAGPRRKIAGFAAVTVIQAGDVADQLLDRKKAPDWQGIRISMMKAMPTDIVLWEQYSALRDQCLREKGDISDATAFYLANREAMDEGAEPFWADRYDEDEVSAVQNAMNLKIKDEAAFMAEYQNTPLAAHAERAIDLTPEHILAKISGVPRSLVRATATKLVGFIDVQGNVLFYGIGDLDPSFGLHVVEYGTYPEQPRAKFSLREISPTIADAHPNMTEDAAIDTALRALTTKLFARTWRRDATGADGEAQTMLLSRVFVDSGWKTELVKEFCKSSGHRASLLPSKGFGFKVDVKPLNEWEDRPGDRKGWNWRWQAARGEVQIDTNPWKTFLAKRIVMPIGERGSFTLHAGDIFRHQMLAEHASSEYATTVEVKGRKSDVWSKRPNHENHLWDILTGLCVAGSEQGILAEGHIAAPAAAAKKKVRYTVKV